MAFNIKTPLIGAQAIADNSTTQKHDLGTIVQAYDATYGVGEFIYLKGVASTIVGSVVTYNLSTFLSALSTSVVGVSNPVAIAMAATVASEFGWYQISGIALAGKANTLSCAVTISLACASGLMIAGICTRPARSAARSRRSPATSSYSTLIPPSGRSIS